ncbi:MAG: hypothetical protein WD077_10200 [Bacteroidia bacterium]
MKNTIILILGLLTVFSVAAQNTPVNNNEGAYNTLYSNFTTTTLSEAELKVFNTRAQQKIQDVLNYIALINNPEIGRQIREHAIWQCGNLFRDKAMIRSGNDSVDVAQFLKSYLNGEKRWDSLKVMAVNIQQPLQPGMDNGYEGRMRLTFTEKSSQKKLKSASTENEIWEVKFYLLKVPKKFGDETFELWEIIFGYIAIAEN